MSTLSEKLRNGTVALGTHVSLNDSVISELIGNLGFDYIWIDTEHTSISLECLQLHLIACRAAGVSAIVRVPEVDRIKAKPVLEMGPDGIIFPQVNSYELAEEAVRACLYPPKGVRGFGPRRAIQFGNISLSDYFRDVDSNTLKILQFENIDALKDLDKILTLQDLDVMMLGPCDLASSMGHLGDVHHPEVAKVVQEFFKKTHAAGKRVGVSFGACGEDEMKYYRDLGVDMLSIAADTDYLYLGAKKVLNELTSVFS
jgi:4-hydroxy-2-oxoheptanedioate aldolase